MILIVYKRKYEKKKEKKEKNWWTILEKTGNRQAPEQCEAAVNLKDILLSGGKIFGVTHHQRATEELQETIYGTKVTHLTWRRTQRFCMMCQQGVYHGHSKHILKPKITHVKKVEHTSEFLFGIYWWTWKTNIY